MIKQVNWADLSALFNSIDELNHDEWDKLLDDRDLRNNTFIRLSWLTEELWYDDLLFELETDGHYDPSLETYLEVSW